MKKIFFSLLALALCSTSLFAYDFEEDRIYYTKLTENTVEISDYSGGKESISIPNSTTHNGVTYTITAIGANAFNYSTKLTYVTLPSTIVFIGYGAFYGCSNLTSINIPNSVDSIASYAFKDCNKLHYETDANGARYLGNSSNPYYALIDVINTSITSLVVNPQTKIIADYALFSGFSNLKELIIGDNVFSIGSCAFSSCWNVQKVTLGAKVTKIGLEAFTQCQRTIEPIYNNIIFARCPVTYVGEYSIAEGIRIIGNIAFEACYDLTKINIPESVVEIHSTAFQACKGLQSIIIPNNVTAIHAYAFSRCESLTSVTLGENLASIDKSAFSSCAAIDTITILAKVPPRITESTFKDVPKDILLYVPAESVEAYKTAEYWNEFTNILPISTEPDVLTSIGNANLHNETENVHKMIENGTIYIICGGEKYTVDGRKVE